MFYFIFLKTLFVNSTFDYYADVDRNFDWEENGKCCDVIW